jgi:hypothetical protein
VCDFEPNEAMTFTLSALPTQDNATLELAGQAIVAG